MASVPEGGNGIEQAYEDDSSGLSNSEILSDSEGAMKCAQPFRLLSQYQNSSKATQNVQVHHQ